MVMADILMIGSLLALSLAALVLFMRSRKTGALVMLTGVLIFWLGVGVLAFGPVTIVPQPIAQPVSTGSVASTNLMVGKAHPSVGYLLSAGVLLYCGGLLGFAMKVTR